MLKNKKLAAMFGLDARIALAIFGALSVISGAALYSTLNQIEVTQAFNTLTELGKAYEAYVLDTGKEIEYSTETSTGLNVSKLVSDTSRGWKGPYFPFQLSELAGTNSNKIPAKYEYVWVLRASNASSFGSLTDATAAQSRCSSPETCYNWTAFLNIPLDLAKKLDEKIDNSDGANQGRLRIRTHSSSPVKYAVYYNFMKAL